MWMMFASSCVRKIERVPWSACVLDKHGTTYIHPFGALCVCTRYVCMWCVGDNHLSLCLFLCVFFVSFFLLSFFLSFILLHDWPCHLESNCTCVCGVWETIATPHTHACANTHNHLSLTLFLQLSFRKRALFLVALLWKEKCQSMNSFHFCHPTVGRVIFKKKIIRTCNLEKKTLP